MSERSADEYYVAPMSYWPIIGTIGLTLFAIGFATYLNGDSFGSWITMGIGVATLIVMLFGWLGAAVRENRAGLHNAQVEQSVRLGMIWFIFSEVMFFAALFGVLFYARQFSIPWLSGEAPSNFSTNQFLWPGFEGSWPSNGPAGLGGDFQAIGPWPIPAVNTLILLSSGVTITWAHWALKKGDNGKLVLGLLATVVLGFIFVGMQAYEYIHLHHAYNITLETGIYGSTFYLLTGFHGLHVIIGSIVLAIMMFRALSRHFTVDNHFAFEAAAWYWHFVDVVWLGLFVFVYVI